MDPIEYFSQVPIFRLEEFFAAHQAGKTLQPNSTLAAIKQHLKAGNLVHVRRGLYAVVPRGQTPEGVQIDPFALATQLAPDAVVAFHGALRYHGKAHSLSRYIPYLTGTRIKPFCFRGTEFVPVPVSPCLRSLPNWGGGIMETQRNGARVHVTTLERTLVDVLEAPLHGGGWEEIWRSLESVEFLDVDAVIDYLLKLRSPVAIARVGFYLEQHREELMVEEAQLEFLSQRAPRSPVYLQRRNREPGKLAARWNLVVPLRILNRTWEESKTWT